MRILFITANRIGDAVLTTGLLAHLEKTYPNARFTIACGPVAADLFRAMPRLEKLIIMKKKKRHGHWIDLWKECFGTRWDLIVDLRNSLITRLLRAEKKAYKRPKETGSHKVVDLARVLDLTPPPAPKLWLTGAAQQEADRIIPNGTIVLAMGPAANWPPKQWAIEKFVALAKMLTVDGAPLVDAKILVVAAPHERDQVLPLLDGFPAERIIDMTGRDLQTVGACLAKTRLFVGNDSGLMHMAAAVGTPTLGLFGPGFENVFGPWGEKTATVRTPETSHELLAKLPYSGAFAPLLMETLSVEAVYHAAQKLIERSCRQH